MSDHTPRDTIAGLIGAQIHTADGKRLGHVVDVELTPAPEYRITALLFGRGAWLYRLHVLHPLAQRLGVRVRFDKIPWSGIARVERFHILLKPDCQPEVE